MNSVAQVVSQFAAEHLQADMLKAVSVLCGAGVLMLILFAAQLFLIYQIEQGRFHRRRQR